MAELPLRKNLQLGSKFRAVNLLRGIPIVRSGAKSAVENASAML
jgi:hypothetical protein